MSFFSRIFGPSRTKQLQDVALALGLDFEVNPNQHLTEMLSDFELFTQSRSHQIIHLFSHGLESKENALRIFDATFAFQSDQEKVKMTILLSTFKKSFLPHFILKPKDILTRVDSRRAASKLISVPQDPTFNKKFIIQAGNKEEVLKILNPSFREKALDSSGFAIEGMSHFLMMYAPHKFINPNANTYKKMIRYMYDLAETISPNRI